MTPLTLITHLWYVFVKGDAELEVAECIQHGHDAGTAIRWPKQEHSGVGSAAKHAASHYQGTGPAELRELF